MSVAIDIGILMVAELVEDYVRQESPEFDVVSVTKTPSMSVAMEVGFLTRTGEQVSEYQIGLWTVP